MTALNLSDEQLSTLGIALAWLIEHHDARLSDGSSNRPSDKLDKLALKISRERLGDLLLIVGRADPNGPKELK